jgi:hypothetical protein
LALNVLAFDRGSDIAPDRVERLPAAGSNVSLAGLTCGWASDQGMTENRRKERNERKKCGGLDHRDNNFKSRLAREAAPVLKGK